MYYKLRISLFYDIINIQRVYLFIIVLFLVISSIYLCKTDDDRDNVEGAEIGEFIEINDENDLKKIGNEYPRDGKYIQMNDITLSGNWTPICTTSDTSFKGTYNGKGYNIRGLTITGNIEQTGDSIFIGLFGYAQDAVFKNVSMTEVNIDCTVEHGNSVHVIAGSIIGFGNALLSSCSFQGIVKIIGSSTDTYHNELNSYVSVGGLTGTSGSTLENCYAKGNVEAHTKTPNATIKTMQSAHAYGLSRGKVSNSYSAAYTKSTVQIDKKGFGSYSAGPISDGKDQNNYYLDTAIPVSEKIYYSGTPKTSTEMMMQSTYANWDFTSVWRLEYGSYPLLRDPYINMAEIENTTFESGDTINISIVTNPSSANIVLTSDYGWLSFENNALSGMCPKENKKYYITLSASDPSYRDTIIQFTLEVKIPIYHVTITKTNGGSVSNIGVNDVEKSSDFRISITPDEGYFIKNVLVNGLKDDNAISNGEVIFKNLLEDNSVEVQFEQIIFTITVHRNGGEYNNEKETIDIPYGSDRSLSFAPNYGYMITSVEINGNAEAKATAGQYLFQNIKEDIVVKIIYDDAVYKITSIIKKGELSETVEHEIKHGKNKEFYFPAEAGHILTELLIDGASFSTTEINYLFNDVRSDRTIEIIFERIVFQIQIDFQIDGEMKNNEIVNVYFGDDYNFGIRKNGYDVSGILVDGRTNHDALNTGNLLLENIQGNRQVIISYQTIKEDFTVITYTFYALDVITALTLVYLARQYLRIRI